MGGKSGSDAQQDSSFHNPKCATIQPCLCDAENETTHHGSRVPSSSDVRGGNLGGIQDGMGHGGKSAAAAVEALLSNAPKSNHAARRRIADPNAKEGPGIGEGKPAEMVRCGAVPPG